MRAQRWPVMLAALCAIAAAAVSAQQVPDRSKPPLLGPVPALKLPAVEKRALSNGLQVWIMGVHKMPTVHIELAVRAGIAADPAGRFGLASLTGDMLDEGAASRHALEIADAIDFLGADLSTAGSVDASFVDLHVPVSRLGDALPIMADVIMRPTFPDGELQRLREERLASLLTIQDDPEQLMQAAFPMIVFGETHRYGTPIMGTPASLKAITTADLKAFHAANYRPDNAAVIVTGDVAADSIMAMLERALGSWKASPPPRPQPAGAAPQLTARRVYLIDKPGAAQSQVRIGWIGAARATPDYFALRVLNTILGEAFTSRLNNNLREVHGYAYGAASRFDLRLSPGAFYAAAAVQTDKTSEAVKEFFIELTRIHEPVAPAELDKAKNYLALQMPRNFETTRGTASALAQAFIYDLPADYYTTYGDRVRAVTAADVKRAADKYLQPDKFAVVIVGDRKVIEPGVKALNLGPMTFLDASRILK
ncbi:MAG: pitrilysin family protein [Vicinamibacterales bacterium]